MSEEKLTKKQRKALEFRKKIDKQEKPVKDVKSDNITNEPKSSDQPTDGKRKLDDTAEEPKKKRKTRRGKKGKGVNGGKGPRFILFVGNLPYDITEAELQAHFKSCQPNRIRIRGDKGIAFLEFDNDTKEIQHKMEVALKKHHSNIRDRKINVELTVGGGGNSETRREKLKQKNEKSIEQRKVRAAQKVKDKPKDLEGVHPSRQNLIG